MTAWIVQALGASTALMVAVLVLRGPVARVFGARAAYGLWALPGLRMVLPPVAGFPSPFDVFPAWNADVKVHAGDLGGGLARIGTAPEIGLHLTTLAAAWALGALLVVAVQAARYRRFLQRAMRQATTLGDIDGIALFLSPTVAGPVATGIVSRRIFLPLAFGSRYSAVERRLALAHERAHHRRRDLHANFAAMLVLCLHWWNPVAYLAYRRFRIDQELACDACVVGGLTRMERVHYAQALLTTATRPVPLTSALSHAGALKERLRSLGSPTPSRRRAWAGATLVASLAAMGLAATAPGHRDGPLRGHALASIAPAPSRRSATRGVSMTLVQARTAPSGPSAEPRHLVGTNSRPMRRFASAAALPGPGAEEPGDATLRAKARPVAKLTVLELAALDDVGTDKTAPAPRVASLVIILLNTDADMDQPLVPSMITT